MGDIKNPERYEALIDKMFRVVQMKGYISDALSADKELYRPIEDKCDNCEKPILLYTARPVFGLFCSEECSHEGGLNDLMEAKKEREEFRRATGKENPRRFKMYRERPEYYERSRFNPAFKKVTNAQIIKEWKMFVKEMIIWYEGRAGTAKIIDEDRFEKALLEVTLNFEIIQETIIDWVRDAREIERHPRKWGARFAEEEDED